MSQTSKFLLPEYSRNTTRPWKVLVANHENPYDINPFVNSLVNSLKPFFSVDINLSEFWACQSDYQFIHIHWPEALFNWQIPSNEQLEHLEQVIRKWKQRGALLVYTRHNSLPHYSQNRSSHERLYAIIENNCDAIVHMGKHSKKELLTRKSPAIENQLHPVIPHHVYEHLYRPDIDKNQAREILKINKTSLVILVFGDFRSQEERDWTMQAFESIRVEDKILVAPRWGEIISNENRMLSNRIVSHEKTPLYFIMADLVFIQRLSILNSGNLPLALLFNKPVVGPNTGNVGEILRKTGNYLFEPGNIRSVASAYKKAISDLSKGKKCANREYAMKHYNLNKTALNYKKIFHQLLKSTLI